MSRRRVRYLVPFAAVAVAALLRLPLQGILGTSAPFSFFVGAVAVSAWLGGFGPGMLAGVISTPVALFWILGQALALTVPPGALGSLVVFLALSAFVSGLFEALRRSRERLERERATLATTLLSIGEGIIVTHADGRVAMMNAVAEQLTGWTLAAARGRPISEVYVVRHELTREPVDDPVRRVIADRQPVKQTSPRLIVTRGGDERHVDDSASPVWTEQRALEGVVLVFRDITARRRVGIDRDLQLTTEQEARVHSELANRMKDEFLAMLSHELRTPLNAIMGWSSMLQAHELDSGQRRHALQVIHRNAEAQSRLIGDLLDVSKFVTGQARFVLRHVDLGDTVRDAVDAVRLAAEAKTLNIELDLPAGAIVVVGDRDRLRQLIWNLVSNAVKFTGPGGRIRVSLTGRDAEAHLTVTDNGSGISPEFLPHVFDRFAQGDSSPARSQGGLGLGLALVRQIAEAHGGTVRAESPGLGQGATFHVTLPVPAETTWPSPSPVAPREASAPAPAPDLSGVRALVVDDSHDNREVAQLLLEHFGAEVRSADSVASALEVFAGWKPDVVVADIGMPGEDGFALLKRLRERGDPDLPVLALTGYASATDRERILQAGFARHLPKPVDDLELARAIVDVQDERLKARS